MSRWLHHSFFNTVCGSSPASKTDREQGVLHLLECMIRKYGEAIKFKVLDTERWSQLATQSILLNWRCILRWKQQRAADRTSVADHVKDMYDIKILHLASNTLFFTSNHQVCKFNRTWSRDWRWNATHACVWGRCSDNGRHAVGLHYLTKSQ